MHDLAFASTGRALVLATLLPACGLIPGFGEEPAAGTGGGGSGSGGSGTGGEEPEVVVCGFDAVDDPSDCNEACDAVLEGSDGRSMCTTTCDLEEQDCEGNRFRCEPNARGEGVCQFDCASFACPDDFACDQDVELCVPVGPG